MARRHLPALALIVGCGGPGPAAERAAATLAAAQARTDATACAAVPAGEERGLCQASAASALAQADQGAAARAVCAAMEPGVWQEECAFLVADGLALAGPDAHQACEQAGRFRAACLAHALAREAQAALSDATAGQEAATLDQLRRVVSRYPPGGARGDRALGLLLQHLLARDRGQPFTAASCGQLSPPDCAAFYVARVRAEVSAETLAQGCAAGEHWLRPDEAARDVVASARRELCP